MLHMDEFVRGSARLIMVLSPAYLGGRPMVDAEWSAKFVEDADGRQRLLIPLMVRDCKPSGLLGPRVYTKLNGLTEAEARQAILDAVRPTRGKRSVAFPGPTL